MGATVLRQLAQSKGLLPYRMFLRAYQDSAESLGYGRLHVGPRTWKRWLAGDVRSKPYATSCQVLQTMFGRPADELFALAGTTDGAHQVSPLLEAHGGMYEMMMDAAGRSRDAAGEAERELGQAAMEAAQDDIVDLARSYLLRSPMEMFPKLAAKRGEIISMRDETRKPAQLGELNFLAGVASCLLAEACVDLGETRHANEHARAAWSYANSIDHMPLAVWARGMMATSAYWAGRPRDAVNAIGRAAQHRPVGIAASRVHSIEARAWSHMGDKDRTVAAIHAAMDARAADQGHVDELQTIGGVFDWDPVREQRCYSSALLQLLQVRGGDFDPAAVRDFTGQVLAHTRQALDDALALPADQRSATVEATIRTEMTTAFVILGDMLNARQTLNDVLNLPANMRTFPVLHRLNGLTSQLAKAQPARQVRGLSDELTEFIQSSTVRALPPGS